MAATVKTVNFSIEQVNPLNKPPCQIKSINFHIEPDCFFMDKTLADKKNNAGNTGINDEWDYKYKINPNNDPYVRDLSGQSASSPALNYSDLKDLADNNNNMSYTLTSGVITNLTTQQT